MRRLATKNTKQHEKEQMLRIGESISVVAEVVRLRSELSRVRLLLTVISAPSLIVASDSLASTFCVCL